MHSYARRWAFVLAIMLPLALPCPADAAADDAALLKDLSAVIALLGLPCGQVLSAVRQGDNDHRVVCRDGKRYRVFVNADGRVVAQKQ